MLYPNRRALYFWVIHCWFFFTNRSTHERFMATVSPNCCFLRLYRMLLSLQCSVITCTCPTSSVPKCPLLKTLSRTYTEIHVVEIKEDLSVSPQCQEPIKATTVHTTHDTTMCWRTFVKFSTEIGRKNGHSWNQSYLLAFIFVIIIIIQNSLLSKSSRT